MTDFGIFDIAVLTGALAAIGFAVVSYLRHQSVLRQATVRLASAMPDRLHSARMGPAAGFAVTIGHACERLAALQHRIAQHHPVTGLDTREVLLDALAGDARGPRALGIIALADFDALAAFDAETADYVQSELAQRLVRMMPAGRLLAQVDRASFAILFEAGAVENVVQELQALCYALRGRVVVPGVEYLPQIRHDHVRVTLPLAKAANVLARALASVHCNMVDASVGPASTGTDIFALEQDLRQAVQKHQFELWYQPVVDARSGTLCSAEALIRWRHPARGMVSPGQFIPVMENMGLSEEIGHWVLDRAARDASAWVRAGLGHVKVAVNLSAHQLTRPDLDVIVERLIARHGLPPAMLELELTETAAAVDAEAVRKLFAKFRARGITIVIDDFGAGYASLSYLKRLEFDKLKIDREFVTNVDTDRHAQAICRSIIALARGLDLTVLGEGVERRQEYDWLRAQGCNLFQGYYFAKPLTFDELLSFAAAPGTILEKCASRVTSLQPHLGVLAA
jgi:EAL domain-containing protein (putative c-di-GMP-specific phosphodiesterase class I)/GGDEF domain-containing protein